ncbi:MAG: sigma 54-interacting transcriptional regulator [Blastocatellia bacterium]
MKARLPHPPENPLLRDGRNLRPEEMTALIDAGRDALAGYAYEEASRCFLPALGGKYLNDEQRATLSCFAAESLEGQARYKEAIEVLAAYESSEQRAPLHPVVRQKLCLRLGSAYGYTAEREKGIAFARISLAMAEEREDITDMGHSQFVLGRICRAIGETKLAHEHLLQALKNYRLAGDKTSMAHAYEGLAAICVHEGNFREARDYHQLAFSLLDENGPPLLLGNIHMNSAVRILLEEQGQGKEGAESLRRAVHYFARAGNKRLLAAAYSNLGFNLLHLGETEAARESLQTAIRIAEEIGDFGAQGNARDTLGELEMICGHFAEAEQLLREGIANLRQLSHRWTASQVILTQGRCFLLRGDYARAAETFQRGLESTTLTEDARGAAAARLWLMETALDMGDAESAHALLEELRPAIEKLNNSSLIAHLRELSGRLAIEEGRAVAAVTALRQAVSIFEMISNRYRMAVAQFHLGRTYARLSEADKAREAFLQAEEIFRQVDAEPMLRRTAAALAELTGPPASLPKNEAVSPAIDFIRVSNAALITLSGAASTSELILHELCRITSQDLKVTPVIACDAEKDRELTPLAWTGCGEEEAVRLVSDFHQGQARGLEAIPFTAGARSGFVLYIGAAARAIWPPRQYLDPLLSIAAIGLEVCQLREKVKLIQAYDLSGNRESELPGMVYQSVRMRELVSEITRIRSSNVTVLVTGESGTGKEVIARAIHHLSDRRDGPFVAFNCTVAPRDIIDSQLFGHRRGAFTGASADNLGVIRGASNGTLFLDEIGDLALDVQPKLLRFLQEGEIQPIGENKPVKVNARVIAATNCDLETLVGEGRFREDLFYRLNVIRLHMPPLRERRDEIPALVTHLIERYATGENKTGITIMPQALDLMLIYDWPGNIRQLANETQRLIAMTPSGGVIGEDMLSPLIRRAAPENSGAKSSLVSMYSGAMSNQPKVFSLDSMIARPPVTSRENTLPVPVIETAPGMKMADAVEELEVRMLRDSIARNRNNLRAVARELGLSPRGLYLKIERYQIPVGRRETSFQRQ